VIKHKLLTAKYQSYLQKERDSKACKFTNSEGIEPVTSLTSVLQRKHVDNNETQLS